MLSIAYSVRRWIILVKELCRILNLWERIIMQKGHKRKKKKFTLSGKFLSPDLNKSVIYLNKYSFKTS